MTTAAVPDAVRRFILTSVPSVPFLEALLLLRAERKRPWDSHGVAARLYVSEATAHELLQELQQSGIVSRSEEGLFVYAPNTPELEDLVEALATTYSHNLVGVTDLIHSRIDKRAHRFADAFRWKKDGT